MSRILPVAALLLALLPGLAEAQYQLVWADEFDGTSLDTSKWTAATGTGCPNLCGWGNNEEQYYRAENATVANGFLTIEARKQSFGGMQYTSARLHSEHKGDFEYGRFEMRAKLPTGQGIWPAFWMFPTDEVYGTWAASGEIDIMELVGHEPNRVHGTTHYGASWPGNVYSGSSYTLPGGSFNDDFHVFAVEWEESAIRWYVDGNLYRTQTSWWSTGGPFPAPFNERFHLILNCAVGGNWPGSPNGSTQFPQDFVIDYVRVYQEVDHDLLDCVCVFDDMEHGNPNSNGYFQFSAPSAAGGINGNLIDVPPVGGGGASLEAGWGAGGAPGYYGGFGRTYPVDLTGATHFEMWLNPDPGQDYVIEVNLQDDDDGDDAIPGVPDGADDEFQYELLVGLPGSGAELIAGAGWQHVAIPLSSFSDDQSYHFGGNGSFDPTSTSAGGNGQLVNVVLALISNSGADISFRTDRWEFTRHGSTVSGRVWNDADGDGSDSGSEPGLAGVTVELVDGALVASQVTGGDGSYAFTSLPKGSYSLRVDPASLPPGMDASFDPDGVASLHEAAVDVDCDQVLLDQSFGYKVAPLLKVTPTLLSQSSGGSLQFALKAPGQPGALYLLFGSLSGVQPGIPLGGGLVLPLNWDAYSNFTAANPNSPPLANSVGTLGSLGQGSASFSVGPGQIPAPLLGALMHHAYVTLDFAGPQLSLVSNAVVTLFVP